MRACIYFSDAFIRCLRKRFFVKIVLYIDPGEIIYKKIRISNKLTPKLNLIKKIYKDNTFYYTKVNLNKVKVYKDILFIDRRL